MFRAQAQTFAALTVSAAALLLSTSVVFSAAKPIEGINSTGSADPQNSVVFRDAVYFRATDDNGDNELYRVDPATGTPEKFDINANASSRTSELTVVGDNLFFSARDTDGDYELWVIRGDATVAEKINIDPMGSSAPSQFAEWRGQLWFAATTGPYGRELWTSDGTAQGTYMVADINASGSANPYLLTPADDLLYFGARDASYDVELYVTDGTEIGTRKININEFGSSMPEEIAPLGGAVILTATVEGLEGTDVLYADDSGRAPEVLKVNLNSSPNARQLTSAGNHVYFVAMNSDFHTDLWTTDGTQGGTYAIGKTNPNGSSLPSQLTVYGPRLLFSAEDGASDRELYITDGISLTQLPINPVGRANPLELTLIDDLVFFCATDAKGDAELWKTDGTAEGTIQVDDTTPDASANPRGYVQIGEHLFFTADDAEDRAGLYTVNVVTDDVDEDGMALVTEQRVGSNPYIADTDTDRDGIADLVDARPLDPSDRGEDILIDLGAVDRAAYGHGFGESTHRSVVRLAFENRHNVDLRLGLNGYDIDSGNEAVVYLITPGSNARRIGLLKAGANLALTSANYFVINSAWLGNGTHYIEIRQTTPGERWGVQNIQLTPIQSTAVNLNNAATRRAMGYQFGSNQHPYLIRGTFNGTGRDMMLNFQAYDIDTTTEVLVVINGRNFRYVRPTGNRKTGPATSYRIPANWLGNSNTIEFIQTAPHQAWGLGTLQITGS